jgi:hypothetical protein
VNRPCRLGCGAGDMREREGGGYCNGLDELVKLGVQSKMEGGY